MKKLKEIIGNKERKIKIIFSTSKNIFKLYNKKCSLEILCMQFCVCFDAYKILTGAYVS